jgi:hypothetical protein
MPSLVLVLFQIQLKELDGNFISKSTLFLYDLQVNNYAYIYKYVFNERDLYVSIKFIIIITITINILIVYLIILYGFKIRTHLRTYAPLSRNLI